MKTAVDFIAEELSKQIDNNMFMDVVFDNLLNQTKKMEKQNNANLLEWIRENAIEVIDGWQCGDEKYTDSELIELYQHLQAMKQLYNTFIIITSIIFVCSIYLIILAE
jgi:hypothetical protein